jgi:hypothetical protein
MIAQAIMKYKKYYADLKANTKYNSTFDLHNKNYIDSMLETYENIIKDLEEINEVYNKQNMENLVEKINRIWRT